MKNLTTYLKPSKNNLFSSMIFLLLGIILFTNPGGVLKFISYIVGGVLCIIGIFNILSYRKTLKKLNIEENNKLISGIILIVLGIFVAIFSSFIETTIRIVCGGWIIYSGILKLVEAINKKNDKTKFYISLSISVLMILCGFFVALNTNLVFEIIGLFIMIYAILEIISYIVYKKK